jgi:hypothetical protein
MNLPRFGWRGRRHSETCDCGQNQCCLHHYFSFGQRRTEIKYSEHNRDRLVKVPAASTAVAERGAGWNFPLGGPGGQCPDGYDFSYNNGRCYPNNYRAPGAYRNDSYGSGQGYDSCPDGYDFNYNDGQCYPNSRPVDDVIIDTETAA